MINTSEFFANIFFNENLANNDVVRQTETEEDTLKTQPKLNISLQLDSTHKLRKAKHRMEDVFAEGYAVKMRTFKRDKRED